MDYSFSKNINTGQVHTGGGNVHLGDNFYKSIEYRELQERIEELKDLVAISEGEKAVKYSERLQQEKKKLEGFKKEIIRLAEIFQKIKLPTDRIKIAQVHFEQGQYKEARAVLDAEQMTMELDELLVEKETLVEKTKQNELFLKNKATEFLLLAFLTNADYHLTDRLEQVKKFFKKSLQAHRYHDNLIAYAAFLTEYKYVNDAIAIYKELVALDRKMARDQNIAVPDGLAESLNNLGLLYSEQYEFEAARPLLEEALNIQQQLADQAPDKNLPRLSSALNNLGLLYKNLGEEELAKQKFLAALNLGRLLLEQDPNQYQVAVALTLNNLAALETPKNLNQATVYLEEALNLIEENPAESLSYHSTQAMVRLNLGAILLDQNEIEKAAPLIVASLSIHQLLVKKEPQIYTADLARNYHVLGMYHQANLQLEKADEAYQQAQAIYTDLCQNEADVYLPKLAALLNRQAFLAGEQKQFALAEKRYQTAMKYYHQLAEQHPAFFNPKLGMIYNDLGVLLYNQDKFADAETFFSGAYYIYDDLQDNYNYPAAPYLGSILFSWGNTYRERQDGDQAQHYYQRALQIRTGLVERNPNNSVYLADLADTLIECAALIPKGEQSDIAESYFQEALNIFTSLANEDQENYLFSCATTMIRVADFYQVIKSDKPYSTQLADQAIQLLIRSEDTKRSQPFIEYGLSILKNWNVNIEDYWSGLHNEDL